jgi:hypothetical protein
VRRYSCYSKKCEKGLTRQEGFDGIAGLGNLASDSQSGLVVKDNVRRILYLTVKMVAYRLCFSGDKIDSKRPKLHSVTRPSKVNGL